MVKLSFPRLPPRITASEWVQALPPLRRYVLRGGSEVMKSAGTALGVTLSETACRAAVGGERAALWLGPDEQLLLGAESDSVMETALAEALRGQAHSLVDVSHRQTALEVTGPEGVLLLRAGCPLDLDPSEFPVGLCTRTVLAKAEIVLWRTAPETFHVEVWRSFAAYVSSFLAEVAREVAIPASTLGD
ncbi:MAG TPA: sarcosine oxidase subunit gamma family protein [Steroidobacteraceae bacterium]|nr:sarcosine oxidase subunit gamma family protein [Steroidobacteraceae bacterium]